jgi:hypothetical protein
VTALGLSTLLLGGAYAALGAQLILAGSAWLAHPPEDPWGQIAGLFGIGPALIIALGVAFLLPGALGLVAAVGVLLRKGWARILTFILGILAVLLGLAWVGGGNQGVAAIALGAVQILYGILAFAVLIRKGAEFPPPRARPGSSAAFQAKENSS